jgi:hypothetical protein
MGAWTAHTHRAGRIFRGCHNGLFYGLFYGLFNGLFNGVNSCSFYRGRPRQGCHWFSFCLQF